MSERNDKANILICEDEFIIAADLETQLDALGYRVCGITAGGEQALELVEKHQPDLVLMDIVLQGEMDGIKAAEIIREKWGVPVVFLTAYAEADRLERAKLTYPFGYLLKPLNERDLKITTEMALYTAKADAERRKLEDQLHFQSNVLNLVGQAVIASDLEGKVTYWNKAAEELYGWSNDEALGNNIVDLLSTDQSQKEGREIMEQLRKGRPWSGVFVVKGRDGRFFDISVKDTPVFDPEGNLTGIIGVSYDITDMKRAERQLQLTLDATTEGVWSWNFKSREMEFTPRYYTMLGYEPGEFPASYENWLNLVHPDDLDSVEKLADSVPESNEDHYENEFRLRTKDGAYRWVRAKAKIVERDPDGRPVLMIGNHQDISNQKEMEESLHREKQRLRQANHLVGLGYWDWDIKTGVLDCSDEVYEIFGQEPASFDQTAEAFEKCIHPEDFEAFLEARTQALQSGHEARIIHRIILPNGEIRHLEESAEVIRNKNGDPIKVSGTVQDITDRVQAEEALRISEERYRQIFETNKAVKLIIDPEDGRIIEANKAACEFYGYDKEEFHKKNITDINALSEGEVFDQMRVAMNEENLVFNFIHRLASGETRDVEVYSGPITTSQGPLLYSIIHDITKRKKFEEMYKDKLYQLQALFDSSLSFIMVKDLDGKFLHVNNRFAESIGRRVDELIGMTDFDLFPRELAEEFRRGDLSIIATGEPLITNDTVDIGQERRHFLGTRTPLIDDSGQVTGICVITTDITEQKETEKSLQKALEEKETLIKELNHRVKNNMQVIISLMRLQAQKIGDERLKSAFVDTQNRIYVMSAVHEILHRSDNLARVDLADYLSKLTESIFNTYRTDSGNLKISVNIQPIEVDLEKSYPIGLVINELLSNTLKYAFPDGRTGTIVVDGGNRDDLAVIRIADDGLGIPPELDWQNADSLGLRLVRSLVQVQLRGTLDLDRTDGTSWTITFPTTTLDEADHETI